MNFFETARSAAWSLKNNKMRSLLSMLGIIIGVAAVVAVVSIGLGAQASVLDRVSGLGSNLIMISPVATVGRSGSIGADATDIFTVELAQKLQEVAPQISLVAPQVQLNNPLLVFGGTNLRSRAVGTVPSYTEIVNYKVAAGRFLHEIDIEQQTNVVILGSTVATSLFGNANPVGEELVLVQGSRRYTFLVVGVMEPKGQVAMGNYDSQVYIPISTAMERILHTTQVSTLMAQATSSEAATDAVLQSEFFLYSRLGSTDGFRVTSQDEMLETMSQVSMTLQLMLAAVSGISLVVGGIGVMNIMLVSVTERTQEIGTRKAIGGKRRDILLQFIMESLSLSVAGGGIGLGLGVFAANAASRYGGWKSTVQISALVIAFSFSAIVGLIAGVYPALKAANLDPVLALSSD